MWLQGYQQSFLSEANIVIWPSSALGKTLAGFLPTLILPLSEIYQYHDMLQFHRQVVVVKSHTR